MAESDGSATRFLQEWYHSQCDGDWEHGYGVAIGTLDNPGWTITVNLDGTDLEGRTLDRQKVDRSEHDWWHAWSDGLTFDCAAGPLNLDDALGAFRAFATGAEPPGA